MKISKRTRERAALICQIAASNRGLRRGASSAAYHLGLIDVEYFVGPHPHPALRLVSLAFPAAYKAAADEYGAQDWTAQMAEAESMLRCGWTP